MAFTTSRPLWEIEHKFLVLQVHDELVIDCPSELVDQTKKILNEVMTQPWPELENLSLPIGIGVGNSWGDCEE